MKNKGYQPATKAIILARVSTEEQAKDNKLSVPAQLRNGRDYANGGGKFNTIREVIAEFCFNESASKDRRNKFEKAIKIVETATEPIAIIADKVDRFQRSFKETARFEELRKDGKVELHFVGQNLIIYRNSPAYELMIWDLFVMLARSYVLTIGDNIKRTYREKLRRGEFPAGLVPTGYLNETIDGKKSIVLDPERAPFVKKCFELYSTEKYSISQLTGLMRNAGFTTKPKRVRVNGDLIKRSPKKVSIGDVSNILREPFSTGKFYYKDPDTGERKFWDNKGTYPILIGWSLYQNVQKILNKNNSRLNGYKKNNFLFRKLIRCGWCGCDFTLEDMSRTYKNKTSPQTNEIYYHCTNGKAASDPDFYKRNFGTSHSGVYVSKKGKRKGETIISCPGHTRPWWKEKDIEECLLLYMDKINYGEEVFEWLRSAMEEDYTEQADMLKIQIKSTKVRLTNNNNLIKNLVHSMARETDLELKSAYREEYDSINPARRNLKKRSPDWKRPL